MARSNAQRGKRSRNRSTFDLLARKKGALKAVKFFHKHNIRGVTQAQYNRIYRDWCKRTAVEYANTPSASDGSEARENVIWERGVGAVRMNEVIRQENRSTKAPLVHVRTSTRIESKTRNARRHYRKMKAKLGWSGKQCDAAFESKFPKQWRLIASDEHR